MAYENPHFVKWLEREGAKRSELADGVGVSRGYVTELAQGAKTPSLSVAVKIERFTGGAVPAASWINAEAS